MDVTCWLSSTLLKHTPRHPPSLTDCGVPCAQDLFPSLVTNPATWTPKYFNMDTKLVSLGFLVPASCGSLWRIVRRRC
jgi:hypothetical protein